MARSLGFTQDITQCDHCGKAELRGTYAVQEDEGLKYYGSVCIGKVFGTTAGKALKNRAAIYTLLARSTNRVEAALMRYAWGTRQGWIVDGMGQRVIEVA